ncbi:DUF2191 domain-containing protein [Actinomyces israelii]|uniref:DUF2191 domain-containing protein n=1 Tax=Actinomyces israelii TaxID=1659 RepID=UPI0023558D52|nr:DUF2191 domain-containing protein [Actinomyces israelii]
MRTTLEIDDRVLAVARERARREGVSLGRAVSDLALRGAGGGTWAASRRGVPLFTPRAGESAPMVTPETVERYRDGEE